MMYSCFTLLPIAPVAEANEAGADIKANLLYK